MPKKKIIIFVLILLLGVFIRIYKLYSVPNGFHVDEAGMFVDASMLSKFGTDRYGDSYPIYLTNFGGGQSVMYAYIMMLLIKTFGVNIYLIRIPSVFFGVIIIIFSYFIGKEFFDCKRSLLLMFFVSICPYFVQSSRIGLDCNLFLSFYVVSFYFFIRAIKLENRFLYFLSGLFFGLCFYTYALSYIVIPLFLLLSCIFLLFKKMICLKDILFVFVPFFVVVLPILLFILVNYGVLNEMKFLFFSLNKLPSFRASEISFSNIFNNLFEIVELLTFDCYDYNAIKECGTVFYLCIPFFVLGFLKVLKNNEFNLQRLILIMFFSGYAMVLLLDAPNINKSNYLYFSIAYFIVCGFPDNFFKYIPVFLFLNFLLFYNTYLNNSSFDKYYFDNELYYISNDNYSNIIDKKIMVDSDNIQPTVFVQMGIVNYIDSIDSINIINDSYNYDVCIFQKNSSNQIMEKSLVYFRYYFSWNCLH